MSRLSPDALGRLPRRAYRRIKERRSAREEARFDTRLRFDAAAPELLLSPHWDDAVLDCWALLSSPRELQVVNVFAGIPAPGSVAIWDAITGAADSAARARERVEEDATALRRAGREPVGLALLDAQYRVGAPEPGLQQLDQALCDALAGGVARDGERPALATAGVYVPAAIGGHADHLLVRRYGRMLARAGIPVTLYADLPYCVLHGWPSWVDGRARDPHRNVDAFWLSFLQQVPELAELQAADVERLDAERAAHKLEAMQTYATQFPCLNYGGCVLEDPAIHGFEVRWPLRSRDAYGATG
jgi:hypothetical protein